MKRGVHGSSFGTHTRLNSVLTAPHYNNQYPKYCGAEFSFEDPLLDLGTQKISFQAMRLNRVTILEGPVHKTGLIDRPGQFFYATCSVS